jgi:ABC-2 type transport system ATP-binding protein
MPPNGSARAPGTPAVEAVGLSRFFGPFAAVVDLSFVIPHGQIVALLGPNGAGKSTTMRMLTGLLAPSAGAASIAGRDISLDRLAACAATGYLPENGPLYADMTPLQLLRFFGDARGLAREVVAKRLEEVAADCGLGEILQKPIGKLSKGLRQRVGLAQALLHDPPVLIMDEPTAGLDPNQIRDFRRLVGRLRGRKTLLISTHILQEAEATADRVLLLHEGRLVFDGTPSAMRAGATLESRFHELTASPARADA